MRSPNSVSAGRLSLLCLGREIKALFAGRSLWTMLLLLSPLVGYSFAQGVNLFGAASRGAEKFPELARGMVPLDGIVVPTFGALYLANTFLLPFVAIRSIGTEKQSGSIKLLSQLPLDPSGVVSLKALALGVGWLLSLLPGLSALAWWLALGGHLYGPELANLVLGHALYALVITGVAFLAAALTESTATAAIVALTVTLGCWVLDFAAGTQTGWIRDIASMSLTAALRTFERGLFSSTQAAFLATVGCGLLALTAVALRAGATRAERLKRGALVVGAGVAIIAAATRLPFYLDVTEDRRNSFNPAEERALASLKQPLVMTVYLTPDDSRLREFERNVLGKLRRVVPNLTVQYGDTGKTGLFGSSTSDRYGLIVYQYAGAQDQSRSTSAKEVLPIIETLSGQQVTPDPVPDYRGYPLVADAGGSSVWFYGLLPALFCLAWLLSQRPPGPQPIKKRREQLMPIGLGGGKHLAVLVGVLFLLAPAPAEAQQTSDSAGSQVFSDCTAQATSTRGSWMEDFTGDTVGADPTNFLPFVGNWSVGADGDNKALLVDGSKWDQASAAAGVAEQAKALYGERYAEFLDNVENYAFFPFVVSKGVDNFKNGTICMRFKPLDGRIDQAGGIIFDVKDNGDYVILRGNSVENNFVLFRYVQGVRTVVKWIRNVDTPTKTWHDITAVINGTSLTGYFDGKKLMDWTLDEPVDGKVGLWSKADSVVLFDDFRVIPAAN